MSTSQTDAHQLLQENIRDNFVSILEQDVWEAQKLLDLMEEDDHVDPRTIAHCQDLLTEEMRTEKMQMLEDYETNRDKHV